MIDSSVKAAPVFFQNYFQGIDQAINSMAQYCVDNKVYDVVASQLCLGTFLYGQYLNDKNIQLLSFGLTGAALLIKGRNTSNVKLAECCTSLGSIAAVMYFVGSLNWFPSSNNSFEVPGEIISDKFKDLTFECSLK